MLAQFSFSQKLLNWYRLNRRALPWRETRDPYRIWISEIMLQQTTVSTVIPFYKKWVQRFPTVSILARAKEQSILKMWQGLGYYSRARNIHRTAKIIVKDFEGDLPSDKEALAALPGFGPYTTGAVGSIAFNLPLVLVDANVRRVIMRYKGLSGLATTQQDPIIKEFLEITISHAQPGDFNQALMELGALICRPVDPLCDDCPVRASCQARILKRTNLIPEKPHKTFIRQESVILLINHNEKYLIIRRPLNGLMGDLWEFPEGEILKGENLPSAVRRFYLDVTGLKLISSKFCFHVSHSRTKYRLRSHVYHCPLEQKFLVQKSDMKFVSLKEMKRYPQPSATTKVYQKIIKASFLIPNSELEMDQ